MEISNKKLKTFKSEEIFVKFEVNDKTALSRYFEDFLDADEANTLYKIIEGCAVKDDKVFTRDKYKMFGKQLDARRITATFGDKGTIYKYSGMTREPTTEWPSELKECLKKVNDFLGTELNYAFVNYYPSGKDSIGYHSDDEKGIETTEDGQTTIASVSLGDNREFRIRQIYKKGETPTKEYKKVLKSGSLCTMEMHTQQLCKHCVPPKKGEDVKPRINITFRRMKVNK